MISGLVRKTDQITHDIPNQHGKKKTQMIPMPSEIDDFLKAYSKSAGWEEETPNDIMYKMCEVYVYTKYNKNQSLIPTAYGYFWGKTNDEVAAGVITGMLELKLSEIWDEVSIKNNWD